MTTSFGKASLRRPADRGRAAQSVGVLQRDAVGSRASPASPSPQEYRIRLGNEIVVASGGDYIFVPRGTPHTYRNVGPETARMLNIMSPADGVELLVELGALAGATVGEEVLTEVHARHFAVLVNPLTDW